MKKIWLLILPMLFLACNESTVGKEENKEHSDSSTHVLAKQKGKWKLDDNTRTNIGAIKAAVNDSMMVKKEGYPALADRLQKNLDTLISQCKMTGEDHEALHRWLEDFITDTRGLKLKDQGETAYLAVREDLTQFDQSFE